ncbi:4332_t:CDS:2 [Racocetra fulgida]|uniref:4332_t:CDS:1 n=1 Tax=Racocetra fulgida TaxID=60492 RepID=A0A9N8YYA4_9GLOM|nr:4332_t:CDS:2 [Racocetra fulgida]
MFQGDAPIIATMDAAATASTNVATFHISTTIVAVSITSELTIGE